MGWSRVQNGAFVPQCRANGRYDAVQCYKGTCWCVDEYGYELPNTRVKSDTPNCNQKPGMLAWYFVFMNICRQQFPKELKDKDIVDVLVG